MNLLIIEPDFILAETYKKAFKEKGINVEICYGAQEAIEKVDSKKIDGIVLEMQLGGHSGIEFLHEFRSYEDWANIPLYIYSAVPLASFGNSKKILNSLNIRRYFYKNHTPLTQLIGVIISDLKR